MFAILFIVLIYAILSGLFAYAKQRKKARQSAMACFAPVVRSTTRVTVTRIRTPLEIQQMKNELDTLQTMRESNIALLDALENEAERTVSAKGLRRLLEKRIAVENRVHRIDLRMAKLWDALEA